MNFDAMPDAETLWRYADDPMAFFADSPVFVAGGMRRLADVWAPFQREAFEVLSRCLQAVAVGQKPPYRGIGLEWTKGAGKGATIARSLTWALSFSQVPQVIEIAADDQGQALEMHKSMTEVIRPWKWLSQLLSVQRARISCERTVSECNFLTRDASGSHGSRPTITVNDELSHCQSEEFVSTMMDNADKMPNNLAVIATNAGTIGSWQYRWRENYRNDPQWWWQKFDEPAPWIDPAKTADAKRRNSQSRYLRLWEGVWSSGGGDALDPADIAACVTLAEPPKRHERDSIYAAALDLGIKHDHSALVILRAAPGEGRCQLVECQSWRPGRTGQVDLMAVEAAVVKAYYQWRPVEIRFDPWQAALMAQRLQAQGIPMRECPFVPATLNAMARALLECFRNRKIELFPDAELIRDLERLSIVERGFGYKLESMADDERHADRAIALAMLLPAALAALGPGPMVGEPVAAATAAIDDGVYFTELPL